MSRLEIGSCRVEYRPDLGYIPKITWPLQKILSSYCIVICLKSCKINCCCFHSENGWSSCSNLQTGHNLFCFLCVFPLNIFLFLFVFFTFPYRGKIQVKILSFLLLFLQMCFQLCLLFWLWMFELVIKHSFDLYACFVHRNKIKLFN